MALLALGHRSMAEVAGLKGLEAWIVRKENDNGGRSVPLAPVLSGSLTNTGAALAGGGSRKQREKKSGLQGHTPLPHPK